MAALGSTVVVAAEPPEVVVEASCGAGAAVTTRFPRYAAHNTRLQTSLPPDACMLIEIRVWRRFIDRGQLVDVKANMPQYSMVTTVSKKQRNV